MLGLFIENIQFREAPFFDAIGWSKATEITTSTLDVEEGRGKLAMNSNCHFYPSTTVTRNKVMIDTHTVFVDPHVWLRQAATVCALVVASSFCIHASAQSIVNVSQFAWDGLAPIERQQIQKSHTVSVVSQDSFGVILDSQGVNESTNGTNGGAVLGGAVANAAYVDSALRGRSYSAVNQLAVGILGAIVGSSLDSRAKAQFHYRYAVKFSNGNIQYFDEVSSEAFRHPAGVCVSVPNVALIDQQLCSQTAESLRTTYLRQFSDAPPVRLDIPLAKITASAQTPATASQAEAETSSGTINCKLGTLAPVRTTPEKCELIKGSQIQ